MRCLSLSEFLAILTLFITVAVFITHSLSTPEVRRQLELDLGAVRTSIIEGLLGLCLLLMVATGVAVTAWFLLCPLPISGQSGNDNQPPPTDTPTPRPSPTPTAPPTPEASPRPPIVKHEPVEVDGSEFRLYSFLTDYYWGLGSYKAKFLRRDVPDAEMVAHLKSIHGDLRTEEAIICVGAASYLAKQGDEAEELRAEDRSAVLVDWMRQVFGDIKGDGQLSPPLYKLNLGHYQDAPDADSQRLIIIIGVRRAKPDAPPVSAILSRERQTLLKKRLMEKDFPFDFDAYSLFLLKQAS
ncbi:MAG TPA: hypothetical protein VF659_17080 [Pyrinomonadaceae bacterium]|jgi:hypothetical protein